MEDTKTFTKDFKIKDLIFIPISALEGDNIVHKSTKTPWYKGPSILELLETLDVEHDRNFEDFRFPVQYVIRPHLDYRGYAGQIASGVVRLGQEVEILPLGKRAKIKSIDTFDGLLTEAFCPQSVTLTLTDEIDISRGDFIVDTEHSPKISADINAMLCWMDEQPMELGKKYLIKHRSWTSKILFKKIDHVVNIKTLEKQQAIPLSLNAIGQVQIKCLKPLVHDPYRKNRNMGNFIIIDELSNNTLAAGMIL